jgi:hypothetical protein
MVISPGAVCLPQFDERILDVLAVAVEYTPLDADAFAEGLWRGLHVFALTRQPHREIGPDSLRGCLALAEHGHGVAPGLRNTMSHRYPSAQFSTVTVWS